MKSIIISLGVLFCASAAFGAGSTVYCYWGTWANGRSGVGAYGVSDLPYDNCTHILYSFLSVDADGALRLDAGAESTVNNKTNSISELIALKEINTSLKVLFAVGGWSAGTVNFTIVANNETLRAAFVSNVLSFIEEYGFDGIDIDWEYPGVGDDSSTTDKEAFVYLLRDVKAAFESTSYELSCAVGVTQARIDSSYNVTGIAQYVDRIVLMTYDYHGSWDSVTGVVAPLYPQLTDASDDGLNANASVHLWIDNGADASQLVLGVGLYGRTFTLSSLDNVSTGAAVSGAGGAGLYTLEAGFLAYYEICLNQSASTWNITEVEGNYAYGNLDTLWVGYDSISTINAKGAYAKDLGLDGVSAWAVDYDDFNALCSSTRYPLLNSAIEGLKGCSS